MLIDLLCFMKNSRIVLMPFPKHGLKKTNNCAGNISAMAEILQILLGIVASATEATINKAYRAKAKKCHPDKQLHTSEEDNGREFRQIKDARDVLLETSREKVSNTRQAFDQCLNGIGGNLRHLAHKFMTEQSYDKAEKLLFSLPDLKLLEDLTKPTLNSQEIISSISKLLSDNVSQIRVEIESNWSERKYKELNDNITDLKRMERHFKAYPQIFPSSWDKGIIKSIEHEIDSLGEEARSYLESHFVAKQKELWSRYRCSNLGPRESCQLYLSRAYLPNGAIVICLSLV